jgi:hypothetical protein
VYILSLMCLLVHGELVAQEMSFSATLSTSKVGTQNQFQVTYKLTNASRLEGFRPPSFSDFVVLAGPIQSSSFSSINGSSQSSISFSYFLQAKSVGTIAVPAASAVVNGKTITSNAATVQVFKGKINAPQAGQPYDPMGVFSRKPPAPPVLNKSPQESKPNPEASKKELSEKVFARIDVNNSNPYVGEQLTAEYNIYTQLPMEASIRRPTSPEGFWVQDYAEDNNPQQSERVVIKGKEYRKYTLRKVALYATAAGPHIIPAVEFEGAVQVERDEPDYNTNNRWSELVGSLLSMHNVQKVPVSLTSESVNIDVRPLPLPVPDNFTGSVGAFKIESAINKLELTTDETATLVYTVRGSGNIKALSKPSITFPGDFEVYDPEVFDTISSAVNEISGYKVFKYTLQPRNIGEIHVPAASFTYFDIETNTYKTLNTAEYTLKVSAGKNAASAKKFRGLPQDIHDIVADDTMQKEVQNLLPESKWYWLAFLLPMLLYIASRIYVKQRKLRVRTPEQIQHSQVVHTATQRLSIAQEMLKEQNITGFYNETSKAIWLYISDRLGVPLSKLNKEIASELLENKQVDGTTRSLIFNTTAHCEQVLYGGDTSKHISEMKKIFEDAKTIITNIEAQLG